MPDENINLEEGQVPSSGEATDEDITLEKLGSMKPEEIFDLVQNSKKAIAAATRRNMETAEKQKQLEAEREYLMSERQRKDAELQRAYDQMAQFGQTFQQAGQRIAPSPRELEQIPQDPEQAFAHLYKQNQELANRLSEYDKKFEDGFGRLEGEIQKTRRTVDYQRFLEKEILPKYEFVTEKKIDDWFTEHPTIDYNPKTVHLAAQEINKHEDDLIESRVQERLKEKAKKAEEAAAATSGAPLASLPDGKRMTELSQAEQEEIIRRDIERLQTK